MSDNSQGRSNCIFCKICDDKSKEGADKLVFSADDMVAFRDIKPAAQHHYLIVPRQHIANPKVVTKEQRPLVERMISVANETLAKQGADMSDTRLGFHWPPFNSVSHIHLHAISPTKDMPFVERLKFKENSWWFVSSDYVLDRLRSDQKLI